MFPNDEVVAYGRANGLGSDYNDIMTAFLRDYYSSNLSLTDLWGRAWAEGYRSINGFTDFPGIANSEFYAPLTSSLILTRGTGDPTYTRATNAWEFDNEGKLILVPGAAGGASARFGGARMVYNQIGAPSQDFTSASWGKSGGGGVTVTGDATTAPDGTLTADKIIPNAGTAQHYVAVSNRGTWPIGSVIVNSIYAKYAGLQYLVVYSASAPSAGAVWFDLINGTVGASQNGAVGTIEAVGDGWYRCKLIGVAASISTSVEYHSCTTNNSFNGVGDGVNGAYLWGPQLENVTGQADQTASEYVSVGVLSAPYHGAGVDGVKWFDTHKDGSAISESSLLGCHSEGARTNSLLSSRDLTNAAWAATNITPAKTATGIDNAANSASTLTASAADATILQTLSLAAAARSSSAYVKRRTGASLPDIALNGAFTGTTNWSSGSGAILSAANNILTVQLTGGDTFGNANQAVTLVGGKTYVITANLLSFNGSAFIGFASVALGATIGTAITKLGIGYATYTPASDGTYYIVIGTNGADTSLTVSNLSCRLSSISMTRDGGVTWNDIGEAINSTTWTRVKVENSSVLNPSIGFKIATSGDEIDVDVCQDEAGAYVSSPIITTTAAVTRNADLLSYAAASNIDVTVGSIYLTAWSDISSGYASTYNAVIIAFDANQFITRRSNTDMRVLDGTNTNNLAVPSVFQRFAKAASSWSVTTSKMYCCVDATLSALTSFDGSLVSGTNMYIGNISSGSSSAFNYTKNLYIWSTALTDAQLQQVTT